MGVVTDSPVQRTKDSLLIDSEPISSIVAWRKHKIVDLTRYKRVQITQSGKNCIVKLRHPRRALDLKVKDLIGSFKNRIVY